LAAVDHAEPLQAKPGLLDRLTTQMVTHALGRVSHIKQVPTWIRRYYTGRVLPTGASESNANWLVQFVGDMRLSLIPVEELLYRVGLYLQARGQFAEARAVLDRALRLIE